MDGRVDACSARHYRCVGAGAAVQDEQSNTCCQPQNRAAACCTLHIAVKLTDGSRVNKIVVDRSLRPRCFHAEN